MSKLPSGVRQAVLERYLRAARRAGFDNVAVEIRPDGTVIIAQSPTSNSGNDSDWDKAFD